jgi:hypothetical protein
MPTGPEHYREAEKLVAAANRRLTGHDAEWLHPLHRRAELRDEAQVHATLALAAATALVAGDDGRTGLSDYDAWSEVASTAAARRRDPEAAPAGARAEATDGN